MKQIVECVANFSEGRRQDVIAKIVAAIGAIDCIQVLGVESDIDHHRSVVTFIGAPRDVLRAAFEGIRVASSLIDLKLHRGQHPRIGAADVIPFVPLRNVTMADCVELARSLGQRVGEELRLPVFLYGEAALQEANRDIAAIRRGGYEALKNSIATRRPPQPDFGPRRLGRAGGCIIGARPILIAFNVYLNTADLKIAKRIAGRIRESSGGMPHVKALGLFVKGKAQVSMNLTNYQVTSMRAVLERIRQEAQGDGVQIDESEVIGLIPRDALAGASARQLQIANFGPQRILEYHLDDAR
ncbi:MAG: glutamate formimidoyltransferase [Chloroflexota bacterium]|nr:glutamate formimidoyltransferase [Chloroflexota bacterium]